MLFVKQLFMIVVKRVEPLCYILRCLCDVFVLCSWTCLPDEKHFVHSITEWSNFDWPVVCHVVYATFVIVVATCIFVMHNAFVATLHSLNFHELHYWHATLLSCVAMLQLVLLCFTRLSWVWLLTPTECDCFIFIVIVSVALLVLPLSRFSVLDVSLHSH